MGDSKVTRLDIRLSQFQVENIALHLPGIILVTFLV